MKRWSELIGAFTLLTRLPVGGWTRAHPPVPDCTWAYPLVGAAVGGLGGLVFLLPLPPAVEAVMAVLVTAALTGALHEDGLADTADGFGGGRTTERKLLIMRDSRIGSFGALALAGSLGLRVAALSAAPHPELAMLLAGVAARGAMLVPLLLLRPARADGLASGLAAARWPAAAGLLLAALVVFASPRAVIASIGAGLVLAGLSRWQVGGYTGDTLGATEQAAECAVLAVLSA